MEKKNSQGVSRRAFLSGVTALGAGLATAGMFGCAPASSEGAAATAANAVGASDEPWYGHPADEGSFEFAEELKTEILVCGFGHAGITATLAAASEGAKVLAIEKNPTGSGFRMGPGAVNCAIQQKVGIDIDKASISNHVVLESQGFANQRVINLWVNESAECFDWLIPEIEAKGVSFYAEPDVGVGTHGGHVAWPTGMTYVLPEGMRKDPTKDSIAPFMEELAVERGAEIRYETSLVQLTTDGDAITGAIAKNADGYLKIVATKGVLLATGGYEGDPELYSKLQPAETASVTAGIYFPQNTGEGIKAGIWVGGVKDPKGTSMLFDRGIIAPGVETGFPVQGTMNWMGSQPFLKVDLNGKRIGNEDVPYDSMIHSSNLHKGHLWCSIWDANYLSHIETFHTLGCSRIYPSGNPGTFCMGVETVLGMNEMAKEAGMLFECDTLDELAEKLQIPADNLKATVEEYNALCEAGVDTQFGKDAKDLLPLTTPPYCGCRFGSSLLCTLDGLAIDEDCHLLNEDGEIIKGVWAAGNASGGFFQEVYPDLAPGIASGRSATQARHAVLNMLGLK